MMKVSLVILNWNGIKDTLECLESIKELDSNGFELRTIIVDNASTNDSVQKLKKVKWIDLVVNNSNLGFAGGNNVGIKYALDKGADYVVILNNDIVLDRKSISELVKQMKSDPKIGAATSKIYFAKGYEYHKDRYSKNELGKVIWYAGGKIDWDNIYGQTRGVDDVDHGQFEDYVETDFATGTCMILSRKVIEDVGMFNEKYYLYYEDTDLSTRIKKAGYKVMFNPQSIIWHKVSQGSGIGSNLNDYFITRNRMMFGMTYARLRTKFALMRESIKLLLIGRYWQKIAIRDYYLGRLGRGSWR